MRIGEPSFLIIQSFIPPFWTIKILNIGLATKWLRILSIPPNDKIRNHLAANSIILKTFNNAIVS